MRNVNAKTKCCLTYFVYRESVHRTEHLHGRRTIVLRCWLLNGPINLVATCLALSQNESPPIFLLGGSHIVELKTINLVATETKVSPRWLMPCLSQSSSYTPMQSVVYGITISC